MSHLLLVGGHTANLTAPFIPPLQPSPAGGEGWAYCQKTHHSDSHRLWGADVEPGPGRLAIQPATQTPGFKRWFQPVLTRGPGKSVNPPDLHLPIQ